MQCSIHSRIHCCKLLAPVPSVQVLVGQRSQVVDALRGWYWPRGHGWHGTKPSGDTLPAGHSSGVHQSINQSINQGICRWISRAIQSNSVQISPVQSNLSDINHSLHESTHYPIHSSLYQTINDPCLSIFIKSNSLQSSSIKLVNQIHSLAQYSHWLQVSLKQTNQWINLSNQWVSQSI